jgi:hypothetical protein
MALRSEAEPTQAVPQRQRRKRWLFFVVLGLGLIVLLWVGLLARDGLALRADVQSLQDYVATLPQPPAPTSIDLNFVQPHVASLHDNLVALRSHAGPLLAIAPALGWLPNIGGDVQAAPALLDMALEFTDLSRRMTTTLAPFWPPPTEDGQLSLPAIARLTQVLQPDIEIYREQIERAQATRERIDSPRLSPRFQNLLARYDEAYPLTDTGLALLAAAPQLLGADQPRTYLILVQNEEELRATGGFLSAAGRVTLDAGKIISLTIEDSYAVDDFTTPYPDPPAPLRDYMGSDLWVFRDSNWSPDFPTAALQASQLYTQTRGGHIDGVIAINQNVVGALVDGFSPLSIDGQTINNAADLRAYMHAAWAPSTQTSAGEWIAQRKNFMGRVMQTLLERMMNGGGQVNWSTLGQALDRTLHSRDLLITLADPTLNAPLHAAHLDGALRPSDGDYLMVVDTSMGFNKVSSVMQQTMHYSVTLSHDSAPQATLSWVYTNTNPLQAGCVHQPPNYDLNTTYQELIQQCYWLYRRVLTPPGAEFTSASRHPTSPGELNTGLLSDGATRVSEEDDKIVFGTLLIVPRGQRVGSNLSYTLPASVVQPSDGKQLYHLIWQKQPGAAAWPVAVTLIWPEGMQLSTAQPQPVESTAHTATFQFNLDMDREVSVTLKSK